MPELHIKEIAEAVNGTVEKGTDDCMFSAYHFDTRLITEDNTLFFAFKTESGDGHRFVRQLKDRPGAGAVVRPDFDAAGLDIPLIRAEDPLNAAQQLASHVRNTHRHIKYIGITGSAGKTTTKEFIYQLLFHKYKSKMFRSFQNWNNWIGMPFSILNMTGSEQAAVFELAMSYPGIGEIDLLAKILRPDVAVILNIYPVHLEFLKTVENAARAKSEILNHLSSDDAAFINGDSEPLMKWIQNANIPKGRKILFGKDNTHCDIRLKEIARKKDKDETRIVIDFYGLETEFTVPLVNRIHIENLFVAIIVAQHLGMKNVEIQEAVRTITPLANRGEINRYRHFTIINETYNSNPEALKKTLDWVDKEYKSKKIAVLGDMLELGEKEAQFHREVGEYFAALDFDRLITVGERALHIADGAREKGFEEKNTRRFDDSTEAGKYLKEIADECKGSTLLFKASRGIQLEKAIEEFLVILNHEVDQGAVGSGQ